MAVTLSHQSALDVIRMLRCEGINVGEMDVVPLTAPAAWVGKRLGMANFDSSVWRWPRPTAARPLHILVPSARNRLRGRLVVPHVAYGGVATTPTFWVDEHTRMASPELLFLQMAELLSLPALVMLGFELCGHFTRQADEPLFGAVIDEVPAATSIGSIGKYLESLGSMRGVARAREALGYVGDHAMSTPEAVLATMYGLPPAEGGYGFGAVTLNERVRLDGEGSWSGAKSRYPDLMFGFAPVGLNYDGSKHFDISELMAAAEAFARLEGRERDEARKVLREKLHATRAKVIDDNLRDRQLAARGRIVFSVTKEDLSDGSHLDELSRQVLGCAQQAFGIDVGGYLRVLDDTSLTRDRWDLLASLTPHGGYGTCAYGRL